MALLAAVVAVEVEFLIARASPSHLRAPRNELAKE